MISFQVGAITKKVKNRASPARIWLGGICGIAIACRRKANTTTKRVNEVVKIKNEGARDKMVNRKKICRVVFSSCGLVVWSMLKLIRGNGMGAELADSD